MGIVRVCWEDTCTNTRDIAPCARCQRGFCPDHLDDATNLCMWCVPVDDESYNEWVKRRYQQDEQ